MEMKVCCLNKSNKTVRGYLRLDFAYQKTVGVVSVSSSERFSLRISLSISLVSGSLELSSHWTCSQRRPGPSRAYFSSYGQFHNLAMSVVHSSRTRVSQVHSKGFANHATDLKGSNWEYFSDVGAHLVLDLLSWCCRMSYSTQAYLTCIMRVDIIGLERAILFWMNFWPLERWWQNCSTCDEGLYVVMREQT